MGHLDVSHLTCIIPWGILSDPGMQGLLHFPTLQVE